MRAAREHGLEIALDYALQCSPDHPWVSEHPEWFHRRPDGTIKYAENPPKKYQDIYPLNFACRDREALWEEARGILLFWIDQGVRTFRVDNPHTKPIPFWAWLIREVQAVSPDVVFLSEAFTRPKVMQALAKVGFTQSYTYFTWRNFKDELTAYLTELTAPPMSDYLRGNLFLNTPDILPPILQHGGPPAFRMRAALAATLSPLYGVYSGYELYENEAVPGTEEYLGSEKYEIKVRDWHAAGSLVPYLTRLNRIRREHSAFAQERALRFYPADGDHVLFYGRTSRDGADVVWIAVNLDPFEAREADAAPAARRPGPSRRRAGTGARAHHRPAPALARSDPAPPPRPGRARRRLSRDAGAGRGLPGSLRLRARPWTTLVQGRDPLRAARQGVPGRRRRRDRRLPRA